MEELLQQLLKEVRSAEGHVVVFIDEIHTILGGKTEGGLGAMSDMLKPAPARDEFPCIGATTVSEYRRYVEADQALARRFTSVWIEEPSLIGQEEASQPPSSHTTVRTGPYTAVSSTVVTQHIFQTGL